MALCYQDINSIIKRYVVGTKRNSLTEMILLDTHNISCDKLHFFCEILPLFAVSLTQVISNGTLQNLRHNA